MFTIVSLFTTVVSLIFTLIYNLPVAWIVQQGYNIIAPHLNLPTGFTFMECYFVWLTFCFMFEKIRPSVTVNKKD